VTAKNFAHVSSSNSFDSGDSDTARGLVVNMSDVLFDSGKYTLRPLAARSWPKYPASFSVIRPSSWPSKVTRQRRHRMIQSAALGAAPRRRPQLSNTAGGPGIFDPATGFGKIGHRVKQLLPKAVSKIAASS